MKFKYIIPLFFILLLSSCASFNRWVDESGLRDQGQIFKAEKIANIHTSSVKDSYTLSATPVVRPLKQWHLPLSSEWKQWHLEFPGAFSNQKAVFFYYTKGGPHRKTILWVPGKGVSNLAFLFLKRLFLIATHEDYDILFYVMPFHMERTPEGMKNGEGLLSFDVQENEKQLEAGVRELQVGLTYLSNRGVSSISGWGGSLGAMILSKVAESGEWDHMVWMIPVINWETIATNSDIQPYLSTNIVSKRFSPIYHHFNVDPNRVLIQAGKWDVLNPIDSVKAFAKSRHIKRLKIYPSGHGAILMMSGIYRDYKSFLKEMEKTNFTQ